MLIKKAALQHTPAKAILDMLRHNEMRNGIYVPYESKFGDEFSIQVRPGTRTNDPTTFSGFVLDHEAKNDPRNFRIDVGAEGNDGFILGNINKSSVLADKRGLEHFFDRHLKKGVPDRMATQDVEKALLELFGDVHMPGIGIPRPKNKVYGSGAIVSTDSMPSDVWEMCRSAGRGMGMNEVSRSLLRSNQLRDILIKLNGFDGAKELSSENAKLFEDALALRNLFKEISRNNARRGRSSLYRVPIPESDKAAVLVTGNAGNGDARQVLRTMYLEPKNDIYLDYAYGRSKNISDLTPKSKG